MPSLPIDALARHLSQPLAPIYVIHGDETLLVLEAADLIRAAARRAGFGERQVFTVENAKFDWLQLTEATNSLSLFSEKKILELRIPSGKTGTEGNEALQKLAVSTTPDVLILLILPRLDRAQQNSKWFTALEKHGITLAAYPIERDALPRWIQQRCQQYQLTLTPDALRFFADRVEGNLLAARQEIDKLALLEPPGEVTLETVQAAVNNVARFDIFALSEAWLSGDRTRTLRMIAGLAAEGESEVLVLWAMTEDVRMLLKIHEGRIHGRPMNDLMRENRLWGKRKTYVEPALRRLTPARLSWALAECAKIDRIIKGASEQDNAWHQLEKLALFLSTEHLS